MEWTFQQRPGERRELISIEPAVLHVTVTREDHEVVPTIKRVQ